jgi:uncharacterized protein YdiU (UPF0061 family)
MESTIVGNSDGETISELLANIKYRYALRKQLDDEVKKIIDVEMQKATMEIMEEHRKIMSKMVQDYKSTIRQVVEEEKVEIWKKAETLKKSMLQIGL